MRSSALHMNQAAAKAAWLAKQSSGGGPVPTTAEIISGAPPTEGEQLVPEVEQDIWVTRGGGRGADDGAEVLPEDGTKDAAREQTKAVDAVLAQIEGLVSALAAANPSVAPEGAGAAQLAQLLSEESLDAVIAPQLPLLMMPGYSEAARSALSKVRTVAQQAALLSLTQYMSGVYDENQGETGTSRRSAGQQGNATLPTPRSSSFAPSPPPQPLTATASAKRTFSPIAALDVALRKGAIDLDDETPRKGKAAVAAVEERILGARAICTAAVDKRVLKLTQPAFEQYMADQFDAAELDRRKAEARGKATAEHAPLTELDRASAEYMEAVLARTKAEAAEDAAEARLEVTLRELEQEQPNP